MTVPGFRANQNILSFEVVFGHCLTNPLTHTHFIAVDFSRIDQPIPIFDCLFNRCHGLVAVRNNRTEANYRDLVTII